jgi:hypothetical protein
VWLASPLCCTPWPVLQNVRQDTGSAARTNASRRLPSQQRSFRALSLRHRLISGSFRLPSRGAFQLSITLLLRYRSQDMFSLGGKCPPTSREISDPRYSKLHHSIFAATTGLSPSMVGRSRPLGLMQRKPKRWVYNTTSPLPFRGGIQFGLCCVHSPLLTASRLISSPAPTQMFQLRAFPFHAEYHKKWWEFPLGNPRIKGSMRLPVAYRSLARPSSVLEPSHPPDGIATPKDILCF